MITVNRLCSCVEGAGVAGHIPQWWKQLFEDKPVTLELPRALSLSDGAEARVRIPSETAQRPDAVDRLGCLLAGLLSRYSTSGRVVVTVGQGEQWLPVAVDFSDDPLFADAVARWQGGYAQAQAHEIPLSELADPGVGGRAATLVAIRFDDSRFPLETTPALDVHVDGDELVLTCDPSVQDGAVQEVADHLRALMMRWPAALRLSEVNLMSESELADLLRGASGPKSHLPNDTVWDLVRRVAEKHPSALALVDDGERISYAELIPRVNAIAAELLELGVGPGHLVGLCVRRSVNMVVGLLAILRSGAAYVPIDSAYPRDRIAMMVEDAELSALVTERNEFDRVLADGLPCLYLGSEVATASPAGLDDYAGPTLDDLAYVIFTSGSTGRPKGVMIGHRALTNFVTAMAREPGITGADRMLAVTTPSFDIAALELLVPLTVGGCVVIASRSTVLDPAAIAHTLEAEAITVMQATPATWRMLLDWGWPGRSDLRVLCGGEALPVALAGDLQTRCAELWNMYGPTETTIWSLAIRLRDGDPVTIGRPIANTTVYVAGPHQELLPTGLAGELLIGGLGVGEGYLGRPEMTKSRFIADPFATQRDRRLYRTGDLVRRRADGAFDFIGRMDNQVKVRGFRIELGDVETILDTHPDVARSVAVVLPDAASGTNRLVAYVALNASATTDSRHLRRHVAAHLPEHMVPSVVVIMAALPLTLNGKVDRRTLPPPEVITDDATRVAPRTVLETQLVEIWERVLGVSSIGVTDEVFELGASSLTTARLFAEVSRSLNVSLPIAVAFQAPDIKRLAALIQGLRDESVDTGRHAALVPIRPQGDRRPLFLVHGGAGTVLLFEPLARQLAAQQPVFAFQAVGLVGGRAPQRSVPDMARLYIDEMKSVQAHGPYRLGGYCFGALVAFEMAYQLQLLGETTELLVTLNGPSPSYIRRYRPLFDANGARTDEAGRLVAARNTATGQLRGGWATRESVPGFLRKAVLGVVDLIRNRARRARRAVTLRTALALHRPLPERLRETGAFQRLAATAQDRYDPGRYGGDMMVVRAAGLYHRDDLGWQDHVAGQVTVKEVPGSQLTPRDSMKDAFVAPIVRAVQSWLDGLDSSG